MDDSNAAGLERRFYAAMIDMVLVAAGCFAVVQARSVLLPGGVRLLGTPAAVVLGILFLSEAITDRSVGKIVMRLRVEGQSGAPATIVQVAARAGVRWFAPLLSLTSVLTHDLLTASALVLGSMILVLCEVPACYITFFRSGGTVFDLLAHTRVRPTGSAGA